MLKATRCGRCPILCRRGEFPLMVLPFGKHTKNINKLWKITKIHHFHGKTHYFDWAIFFLMLFVCLPGGMIVHSQKLTGA